MDKRSTRRRHRQQRHIDSYQQHRERQHASGSTPHGGGIINSGTLTLTNSTVSGNTAGLSDGGGIFNSGTLTLTNSTVSGNRFERPPAAPSERWRHLKQLAHMTLTNSTVSGNSTDRRRRRHHKRGTWHIMTLINSTVSGNRADLRGGGGINNSGTANLFNATIANNEAGVTVEGCQQWIGRHFNFQNTILAGNFLSGSLRLTLRLRWDYQFKW